MVSKIKLDKNFKNVLFLGDIHGNFFHISWMLNRYRLEDTLIVQVGDFGVGFDRKKEEWELKGVNNSLERTGCKVIAMRGNHDDPSMFNNNFNKNILMVRDFTIVELVLNGMVVNVLFIGGAISIDRKDRKPMGSWWEDEVINVQLSPEVLDDVTGVNVLVTHTAPDFVEPYFFGPLVTKYASKDPTLLEELKQERRSLSYMVNYILERNPDLLQAYYGHFHHSAVTYYNGVQFNMLGIEEMKEFNAAIYNSL